MARKKTSKNWGCDGGFLLLLLKTSQKWVHLEKLRNAHGGGGAGKGEGGGKGGGGRPFFFGFTLQLGIVILNQLAKD